MVLYRTACRSRVMCTVIRHVEHREAPANETYTMTLMQQND